MINLKVKLLPGGVTPTRAKAGDAGLDIYSPSGFWVDPHEVRKVPVGVAFEIPEGHCLVIKDRSGLAAGGIHAVGGVVDEGYRGEVAVLLANLGVTPRWFDPGDRIAQALVIPVPEVSIAVVDELGPSVRGHGGFGSTGA